MRAEGEVTASPRHFTTAPPVGRCLNSWSLVPPLRARNCTCMAVSTRRRHRTGGFTEPPGPRRRQAGDAQAGSSRGTVRPYSFGSSSRDEAGEVSNSPPDVTEIAQGHVLENKVQPAYLRANLFARRAKMMQEWADYAKRPKAEVLPLEGKSTRPCRTPRSVRKAQK